jgi:hypothetical protein
MRTPPLGPNKKSGAWRVGAFAIGLGFVLKLMDWFLGDWFSFSWGFVLILIAVGLALSAPWGFAWAAGKVPATPAKPEPIVPTEVKGESGSTYVIVQPPQPKSAAGQVPRWRPQGGLWGLVFFIVYDIPIAIGDTLLTGFWAVVGRMRGVTNARKRTDADGESRPDQQTF